MFAGEKLEREGSAVLSLTSGGHSSIIPLSECLQMTMKMLGVLILSL